MCDCPETPCPDREDGTHCEHWYCGLACCACGAPECSCPDEPDDAGTGHGAYEYRSGA